MKNMKSWPHKWFGSWMEMGSTYSHCPSIYDWVIPERATQYGNDLPYILHYLANGYCLVATSASAFPNVITGERRKGSLSFRTDGVWIWQDDLGDYIVKNKVAIPEEFFIHMKDKGFILPDESYIKKDELEWPPD